MNLASLPCTTLRRLLAAAAACVALAGPALAQVPDEEFQLGGPRLSEAERAELQATLALPEPAGATYLALTRHFERQYLAALRLRAPAAALERILDAWIAAVPDNALPRWMLASVWRQGERRPQGYALAREVLAATREPRLALQYRSQLAQDLLGDNRADEARRLLEEAAPAAAQLEDLLARDRSAARAARLYALNAYQEARCALLAYTLQLADAITQCQRATEGARALVESTRAAGQRSAEQAMRQHVQVLTRLAVTQAQGGRPHDAEQAMHETLQRMRDYGFAPTPLLHLRLARVRLVQERPAQALALSRRAAELVLANGGNALSNNHLRAHESAQKALALLGRWDDALADFERNDRAVAGQPDAMRQAENLITRAVVYAHTGRIAELERRLRESTRWWAEALGAEHRVTLIRQGLWGLALLAQPQPEAQARGAQTLESAVRGLLAPGAQPERDSVDLMRLAQTLLFERYLAQLHTTAPAAQQELGFRLADQLRGSSVQQALNDAAVRGAVRSGALATLVRQDQDARLELQGLHQRLAQEAAQQPNRLLGAVQPELARRVATLEAERTRLREALLREFPDYARLVHPLPPRLQDVAARLAPDEAFVAIWPAQDQVHVWAIGPHGSAYHRAGLDRATLQALVARLRATLDVAAQGAAAPAFDHEAAHTLYRELLAPLEPALAGTRHWVMAPGGALGQLPLGVLLTAPAPGGRLQDAAWLIRRVAVSHVASAAAWMAVRGATGSPAAAGPATLAGWGDPVFDRARSGPAPTLAAATRSIALSRFAAADDIEQAPPRAALDYASLPPLPETRGELEAIARALQADPGRDLWLGERATRASVLQASRSGALARARVVVFATHGLVAGDLPNLEQPALALSADERAPADPLAPLLTLEDVLSLQLDADWVVLSACNTAAGDGQAQEALSGLARGFFYAGGRSLLVTHWAVETHSATALTTRALAEHARAPGLRRAESLRRAMLQVMTMPHYGHPSFWAPFALVGDGAS